MTPSTIPAVVFGCGLAAIGAGLAWYAALMRPIWASAALGPICGHGTLLIAHCPACYAALALAAAGVVAAATVDRRTRQIA